MQIGVSTVKGDLRAMNANDILALCPKSNIPHESSFFILPTSTYYIFDVELIWINYLSVERYIRVVSESMRIIKHSQIFPIECDNESRQIRYYPTYSPPITHHTGTHDKHHSKQPSLRLARQTTTKKCCNQNSKSREAKKNNRNIGNRLLDHCMWSEVVQLPWSTTATETDFYGK